MRCRSLVLFAVLAFFVACGGGSGGDDDGNNPTPDAAGSVDAPPAGLSGLGQKCDVAMMGADCPANAPACVGFPGTTTYCSPQCVTNGTAKGAANDQFDPASIMPAPDNTICAAAYTGSTGTPVCAGILPNFEPMDQPVVVGKTYTNINMTCAVACTNNACPTGLVANTSLGPCLCLPQ